MFNARALVAKSRMALGKSLILILISGTAHADTIWNPRFFSYQTNNPVDRIVEFSFGWNKKLNQEQKSAYYQSIVHAVEYAENGQAVEWYQDDASGFSEPVMTWPNNNGYCRRLHLNVIAFNKQKAMSVTACHSYMDSKWTWYSDK